MTSIDDVIRLLEAARDTGKAAKRTAKAGRTVAKKTKRKASAYQQRYGKHFKRLAPKYKLKSGGWKKDGFRRCQAAAHRAAKGGRK